MAIRLMCLLTESYSAEVLAAVLEGMHALVAFDPSLMHEFFKRCTSHWSRRWVLNASEAWAVLHSEDMPQIVSQLERILQTGEFEEKLQAWIVLCRYCDSFGLQRPLFPIPEQPARRDLVSESPGLPQTPLDSKGRHASIDRHRSAQSMLERLEECGFDFSSLEGAITDRLFNMTPTKFRGPHRRNPFYCGQLDSEVAVGDAIESVLATDWCGQELVPLIAQAFLGNEDAWLQRKPPRPAASSLLWPSSEQVAKPEESHKIRDQLIDIVMNGDVPAGWMTFSGRVIDSTWKDDFALFVWWEQSSDRMIIRPSHRPTTLSGRSFVHWLGDFFEPDTANDRFVSGFRAGGLVRLHFCSLEIQPSKAWRSLLGWSPDPQDPLSWLSGEKPIARYDRIHGPLRDNPYGPGIRQPVVERWLVTIEGFRQAENLFGRLRRREDLELHRFES